MDRASGWLKNALKTHVVAHWLRNMAIASPAHHLRYTTNLCTLICLNEASI
jgi:hypothetical protein